MAADEVRKELKQLRSNKAADSKGLVAEMVKFGGDELAHAIADFFDGVLQGNGGGVPVDWKIGRSHV